MDEIVWDDEKKIVPSKRINLKTEEKKDDVWFVYKDIKIHYRFFMLGIILIMPNNLRKEWNPMADDKSFHMKDRVFSISENHKCGKAGKLLTKLTDFSKTKNDGAQSVKKNGLAIVNSIRRDEFFLPISFGDSEEGIYIYPWLSENKITIEFNGFTQYVTAGCLFGASLKGEDQHGGKFSLIKHDIKFFADQKIQFIMYDEKESPYENMLFIQLEKTCQMINSFTVYENKKSLLYHLPYYDYILFGIELFLRGRITHDALSDFFEKVLKKKSEHTDKINLICKKYNILSAIFSPFENIFGALQSVNEIFDVFELRNEDINPEKLTTQEIALKEKLFVLLCLQKLKTNMFNIGHQQAWIDFTEYSENKIEDLEGLFKIANTIPIAVASKGKEDYKTCSILPLSEKQIQVGYSKSLKELKNNQYPKIFHITMLDPLLSYTTSANNGLLFYFDHECSRSLTRVMIRNNLVKQAYKNIGLFSNSKEPLSLKELVAEKNTNQLTS